MTLPSRPPSTDPISDICASVEPLPVRPRNRLDCVDSPRPCPYALCRYHLATDITPGGKLRVVQPEPEQWGETCALDVASGGPCTGEEVAEILGLSRNAVIEIEQTAIRKLRKLVRKGR